MQATSICIFESGIKTYLAFEYAKKKTVFVIL